MIDTGAGNAKIGSISDDNTLSVFTSAEGSSGTIVSVGKAALLSALTIDESRSGQEHGISGSCSNDIIFSLPPTLVMR